MALSAKDVERFYKDEPSQQKHFATDSPIVVPQKPDWVYSPRDLRERGLKTIGDTAVQEQTIRELGAYSLLNMLASRASPKVVGYRSYNILLPEHPEGINHEPGAMIVECLFVDGEVMSCSFNDQRRPDDLSPVVFEHLAAFAINSDPYPVSFNGYFNG